MQNILYYIKYSKSLLRYQPEIPLALRYLSVEYIHLFHKPTRAIQMRTYVQCGANERTYGALKHI